VYEFLEWRVKHVMTARPITIAPNTSLAEAQALFERHDFDALPVLDAEGRLVGMLSKLDLCQAFAFGIASKVPHYDDIVARPISSVMSRSPVSVPPELPLTRALQKMIEMRFKSLPVVGDGRLVGIVAREDVLRAVRRAAAGERPS
jgi:CBS domain-containing protein